MRVEHLCVLCGALLAAGCDVVFRLDPLDPQSKAATDARDPQDASDAPDGCGQDAHDEDGDGVTDACDVCPGIADDQRDSDGDGVGDACDPSPTTAERIALFVSFAEPSAANDWNVLDGSWRIDAGDLVYESTQSPTHGHVMYAGSLPEPPYVLEYRFTIASIPQLTSVLSVIADATVSGQGVVCALVRRENPVRDVVRAEYVQGALANEASLGTTMPGPHHVRMSYQRAEQLRCTFDATATAIELPAVQLTRKLMFRALRVGARIHHVVVYAPAL